MPFDAVGAVGEASSDGADALFDPSAPFFNRFNSRRSVVYSTKGIVAASQPLAAQAGLDILKAGGNAVDAAIATAAALGVTEPCSTGVGGDMFMIYWDETKRKAFAINGSGRSPAGLTIEKCRELGMTGNLLPPQDANSVTVPGQVAAWFDAKDAYGSGKVTMEQILKPSIELCKDGFPVSEITARQWIECEGLLKRVSPNGGELLLEGKAPRAGQVFKNPNLGKVLREIASNGRAGFYEGWVAEAITSEIQQLRGVMTTQDLKDHTTTFVEPISKSYQEYKLLECPPNGQGIVALEALGIIDNLEKDGKIPSLKGLGHNSTQYIHTIVEALRYAFADADAYVSDPEHSGPEWKSLLDDAYLKDRVSSFKSDAVDASLKNGFPSKSSDTVYFTTSDSEGNACSFICSLASNFGSGIVPKGCGFALQNRGTQFQLREGHVNTLRPRKRPYHTIIPAMVTKNDRLELSVGVMGGFMQPQGHLQVMLNSCVFGLNPQDALDAPRVCIRPSRTLPEYATADDYSKLTQKSIVCLEEGFPQDTVEGLRKLGHEVQLVTGWDRAMFGRGQIIQAKQDPSGLRVYHGGSDQRGDGHAVAW
ncbi:gamma-glutamyltranspeptidase [Trichoderma citrinoviride]|uniref:Gamma-glutamyltranspeptidase n=1 Tax=Trichoderma citrinoviride TaxID=58853 RepID=A0A2T4BA36_9HYPO|nr:gamma-glutamyltranspeptidase [Trichoderma citrinoviride]PTB66192.1 gamma-glutamyltranspeptidase [Trichoderma citrinoviride]